MKVILLSCAAALALGAAAAALLSESQRTAYQAYSTTGARVSEPGHNLVGPRWNGQPEPHGKPAKSS